MNTDSQPLNDVQTRLHEALAQWRIIKGIDPAATSQSIGQWRVGEAFKALQEAIDLDPTGVTAAMLLSYFVKSDLSAAPFSMLDLIRDSAAVEAKLTPWRQLLVLVEDEAITRAASGFIASVRRALAHYGAADREDIKALLDTPDEIAILRRDALRSIANLRVDQFLDGTPEPPDVSPVYVNDVHQWWNMNSLLAACARMPSGVSLNLIRHPDQFQSYFAFAVRNGGNLFVMSDTPDYSHPLQGYMSRRPDRNLDRRISRNWFPYELLGVAYDEESGELYFKASQERRLIAYQNEALPLKPVDALDPHELVWLVMMFDLLVERFWRRNYKSKELSYTAEMLKAEMVLRDSVRAKMPVIQYQPVGLSPLKVVDISDASVDEAAVGKKYHKGNLWMEERYGHRVNEDSLNLVAVPEAVFYIDHPTGALAEIERPGGRKLQGWDQRNLLAGKQPLDHVDAASFGTREQIDNDRRFIARVNYAKQINSFAREEFKDRREEVSKWYAERVRENATTLLAYAGNAELWVVSDGMHGIFSSYKNNAGGVIRLGPEKDTTRDAKKLAHSLLSRTWQEEDRCPAPMATTLGQRDDRGYHRCYLKNTRLSLFAIFYPTSAAELALVAGCTVTELPDVLQHWTLLDTYTGNSILDRVDPMIWKAENPWCDLDLRVRIALSKRGLAQIEKAPVAPEFPNLVVGPPGLRHSAGTSSSEPPAW